MALTGRCLHAMDENLGMREVPIYRSEKRLVEMEKHLVEKLGEIKLWMMGLSVAQAASLLAIAKGLKWI